MGRCLSPAEQAQAKRIIGPALSGRILFFSNLSLPMPSPSPTEQPDTGGATPSAGTEPRALYIEDGLTVLIMAALALITLANVLARYFTNNSIAWTEEISVFLMIALALVAGSAAVARDRHIRIEYFAESGSGARRRFLARFGALMVALLFGTIAVLSVRVVWDDYRFEETSPGIGVPQWWYSVWLPIFSALITVRAIGLFIRRGKQPDVEFLPEHQP